MALLKRTYALPPDALKEFENAVAPGKRSGVITELLQGWLEEQRRQKLRREVTEGCQVMADVYLELARAYHPLEEEVERALDAQSEAG
jgi:hypothetical protein